MMTQLANTLHIPANFYITNFGNANEITLLGDFFFFWFLFSRFSVSISNYHCSTDAWDHNLT
jgi:hypothetical protein